MSDALNEFLDEHLGAESRRETRALSPSERLTAAMGVTPHVLGDPLDPTPGAVYSSRTDAEDALTTRFAILEDEKALKLWDTLQRRARRWESIDKLWECHMPSELVGTGKNKKEIRSKPSEIIFTSAQKKLIDALAFFPHAPAIFQSYGRQYGNTWRSGPTGELKPPKFVRKAWFQYLRHLFPRGVSRKWLHNYFDGLAYLVQNPGTRLGHCNLLVGKTEGSGKTILISGLTRAIFGVHNVRTPGMAEVHSTFTGWLSEGQIIIFNEMSRPHDPEKAEEIANNLLHFINGNNIPVHRKGLDGAEVPNKVSFFGTSNKTETALLVADTSRRYAIECVNVGKLPKDIAIKMGALGIGDKPDEDRLLKSGEMLRWWLSRRNIRGFDPNDAIETEALQEMRQASNPEDDIWLATIAELTQHKKIGDDIAFFEFAKALQRETGRSAQTALGRRLAKIFDKHFKGEWERSKNVRRAGRPHYGYRKIKEPTND